MTKAVFVFGVVVLLGLFGQLVAEEQTEKKVDYDADQWLLVAPAHSIQREAQHFLLPPPEHSGKPPHHESYASFLSSSYHTHHVPMGLPGHVHNQSEAVQLMAIVLIRHGDRTPTTVFENSLSVWPEGSGQLTGLGMKQQHDLGAMLRQRYVMERSLVEPYWRLDQIYCRSTARTRSLQSAYAFFTGFFPPGTGPNLPAGEGGGPALPINLQPVPVMAASRYNDTLLYAYKNCPRLKELIKENRRQAEWLQKTDENRQLFANLSSIFGEPIGLKQMTQIRTLLNAERIHGKPQLPGITQAMWDKINELGAWVLKYKFRTHEMGKLAAGELPVEIRNRMRNILIDHYQIVDAAKAPTEASPKDTLSPHSILLRSTYSEPSFVLFSAHDGTILALLSALRAKDPKVPYFSSFLTFELFAPVNDDPPYVKLWYDDQPLNIPGCDHRCTFAEFSDAVELSHEPDWYRACDIPWMRPLFADAAQSASLADVLEMRALRAQVIAQQQTIDELQAALDYKQYKREQKEHAEQQKEQEKAREEAAKRDKEESRRKAKEEEKLNKAKKTKEDNRKQKVVDDQQPNKK